jgi:hypothetical protein
MRDDDSRRSRHSITFVAPLGVEAPPGSRASITPWSVFQDGSGGTSARTSPRGVRRVSRVPSVGVGFWRGSVSRQAARRIDRFRGTSGRCEPRSGRTPSLSITAPRSSCVSGRGADATHAAPVGSPLVFARLGAVGDAPRREVHLVVTGRSRRGSPLVAVASSPSSVHDGAESRRRLGRLRPFASERFHALLNSLFKVLCNFPSWYLFAIEQLGVFSLGWGLPPALGCTPEQPDSAEATRGVAPGRAPHRPPAFSGRWPRSRGLGGVRGRPPSLLSRHSSRRVPSGFGAGLLPVHSPLLGESSLLSFRSAY